MREAIDNDRLTLTSSRSSISPTASAPADEMLVRMLEPDGTVLAPAAFLPTAERFGLIREIDRWVIDRGDRGSPPPASR